MSRRTLQSQRKGNDSLMHSYSGQAFTTEYTPVDLQSVALTHIVVGCTDDCITFLEVTYNTNSHSHSARYGFSACNTTHNITLDSSEWIVKVEGGWFQTLTTLAFSSNKGKTYGPYGRPHIVWNPFILEPSEPGFGVLWMNGYWNESRNWGPAAGHWGVGISSLQVTFAEYPPNLPPTFLTYEDGDTSAFLRQLQSPSVTLLVGMPAVALTVHDYVLSALPYFRAALHGGFLEASSKTIKMPEDNAAVIAAFIEYLTHGSYTYAHRSSQHEIPDLEQGLFHLRLYAAAMKYGYGPLRESAMESLQFVMKHLHGMDALKLWQDLYSYGLTIGDLKALCPSKVRDTIKKLYTENPIALLAIFDETPSLSSDILKLVMMTE